MLCTTQPQTYMTTLWPWRRNILCIQFRTGTLSSLQQLLFPLCICVSNHVGQSLSLHRCRYTIPEEWSIMYVCWCVILPLFLWFCGLLFVLLHFIQISHARLLVFIFLIKNWTVIVTIVWQWDYHIQINSWSIHIYHM